MYNLADINLTDVSTSPGVYIFIDAKDQIIYVGKAKNLRNRLSSYLNASAKTIKTTRMIKAARTLKFIVTSNEVEAFILEMNLIKTEQPKYNILLKDSKGYPYVKLTNERYPRLVYTRNTDDRGAFYFGPFVNASELKWLIEYLREIFPLRTCNDAMMNKGKFCMKYQIKRCCGPCEGVTSEEDYEIMVEQIKRFFKGEVQELKADMQKRMEKAAEVLRFEDAAFYRDRLKGLSALFVKQRALQINDKRNIDLFYYHETLQTACVTQLFVRGGRLLGARSHFFPAITDSQETENELLEQFIMQFYANVRQYPDVIVTAGNIDKNISDAMIDALIKTSNKKIIHGKRGYNELISLAEKNAEKDTEEYVLKVSANADLFPRLSAIAGVDVNHVECIDIRLLGGIIL